jgi:hypothetical protein
MLPGGSFIVVDRVGHFDGKHDCASSFLRKRCHIRLFSKMANNLKDIIVDIFRRLGHS